MTAIVQRAPFERLDMNGASKRRSARLSNGNDTNDDEPAQKKAKTVATKQTDGGNTANGTHAKPVAAKRGKRAYTEVEDDFTFSRSKKTRAKTPAVRTSEPSAAPAEQPAQPTASPKRPAPAPETQEEEKEVPKTGQKGTRRLPTTPEQQAATAPRRKSKRLSNENQSSEEATVKSPAKAHARSHQNAHDRQSRSPERPVPKLTVTKKRGGENGEVRIALPWEETPIVRRNKQLRQGGAATPGQRRSSSGMRGRRASSLIDEGRGNGKDFASHSASGIYGTSSGASTAPFPSHPSYNSVMMKATTEATPPPSDEDASKEDSVSNDLEANSEPALPHSEVPTSELYKHIGEDLTEPRRMRILLGWCGTRSLPHKPEAPKESSAEPSLEFQARQSALVIQQELSQDLVSKGTLSDWFSRDEDAKAVTLVKRPNPRNVDNLRRAEELEAELAGLKVQQAEWESLLAQNTDIPEAKEGSLSTIHSDILEPEQASILAQLRSAPPPPDERLKDIAANLEFQVDHFASKIHALSTLRDIGERVAGATLKSAETVLSEREAERKAQGGSVDAFNALKGLARLYSRNRE